MPADTRDMDDAALLRRAAEGDRRAFGRLYEHYREQIYRYVYYRISDEPEAEDVTETVFLKAWQTLPRLREGKSHVRHFRAWLYRIAHNTVMDYHRNPQKVVSLESAKTLQDPAPMPEFAAQSKQENQNLQASIARLEPKLQQVLLCRFINQLSHNETAEIMGINEGHVRVLQHRALKRMAELMAEDRAI
ncbi:MAG: sigma-70 family RNA polymerase sigma factor [Anaerolineae bacterium]|nr:sigma-70 family RNA polymerase sigma factor [Anaerolineae bacterium]